ncbi:MAG: hypothetical protein IJO83_07610 [Clostridia bacterium]|nr:hypothetical protein [Clostridia bacterium]
MFYKVSIDRKSLKKGDFSASKGRKIRNGGEEGNQALFNQIIYNLLLKEARKNDV